MRSYEIMTATRPKPRPGVLDIAAYVPGKSSAPGVAKIFKLSSNETPLGPSPRAIAAYKAAADHLEDYPDGSADRSARGDRACVRARSRPHRLRRRLRRSLASFGQAYLVDGDEAIHTMHGFLIYPIATLGTGASRLRWRRRSYTANVDAILAR